jgi:CheY-like chemotaxis protein
VLVVDDVPVMRRFLRECLGHAGWESAEASGAEEALAMLGGDGQFALLIADLHMPPGSDGIVLIREARERHPGLPAILITGSEAPPSLALVAEREGFTVLRKPVSPAELAGCVACAAWDAVADHAGARR